MGDPAALQEAIQRARQLAAKIGQPPNKRAAEESIGSNETRPDTHSSSQYHNQDSTSGKHEPVDYGAILKKARTERELSPPYDNNNDNSNGGNNNTDKNNTSFNGSTNNDGSYSGYTSRNYNNPESNNYYSSAIGRADKSAGPVSYQHGPTTASIDIYSNLGNPSNTRLLPPSDSQSIAGSSEYGTVNQNKVDILIPQQVIGLVIGKGGENIKRIQNETGATVRVDPSTMDDQGNKMCNINGSADSVKRASTLVNDIIENALASKRPRAPVEGGDEYRLKIPAQRTGAIIGRGGDTIRTIKQQSGCDIELDKNAKDCGPDETVFIIRGTQERIQNARELIQAKLASGRGPPTAGGPYAGGQPRQKPVATGANAAPLASYNDLPSAYPSSWPQQGMAGSGASGAAASMPTAGQPQASADNSAAWTAYYAQYYAQYQAQAQSMSSVAYPGQAALAAPAAPVASMPQYNSNSSETTPAPSIGQPSQQQADYSQQWIEYYKYYGMHKEAEAVEQMKQQQKQ